MALVLTIRRFTWMSRKQINAKNWRITRCFVVISHLLQQQNANNDSNKTNYVSEITSNA